MEQKRMGRGLSSLLGDFDIFDTDKQTSENGVKELDIKLLDVNKNQPRKNFDAAAMEDLANSIKTHGVIQPILVVKKGNRYQIVAGERRFRASMMAGLKTVPVIVKEYDEKQIKEIALLENIQREDLNPIECARGMDELLKSYGWTQEVLAERMGKSRPAITNILRLLQLTPPVIKLVEDGKLSAGHARTLVMITNPELQLKLAQTAVSKNITVRDLERQVAFLNAPKKPKAKKTTSVELKELTRILQKKLSTKVKIVGDDNKGKIDITYYTRDDLERIMLLLNK